MGNVWGKNETASYFRTAMVCGIRTMLVFSLCVGVSRDTALAEGNTPSDSSTSTTTWTQLGNEVAPSGGSLLWSQNGTVYTADKHLWSYSAGRWKELSAVPSSGDSLQYTGGSLYAWGNDGVSSYINGTWTKIPNNPVNEDVSSLLYADGTLYEGCGNFFNDDYSRLYAFSRGKWKLMTASDSATVIPMLDANGTLYIVKSSRESGNPNSDQLWAVRDGQWTLLKAFMSVNDLKYVNGTLYVESNETGKTEYSALWEYRNGKWVRNTEFPSNLQEGVSLSYADRTLYAIGGDSSGDNYIVWNYRNGTWRQNSAMPPGVTNLQSANGTLYASTDSGVWVFRNGAWQATCAPAQYYVTEQLYENGTLYVVGQYNEGTAVLSYSQGNLTLMKEFKSGRDLQYSNGRLYVNADSSVWTWSHGIWRQMAGAPSGVTDLQFANRTLYAETAKGGWMYTNGQWKRMTNMPVGLAHFHIDNGTLYAEALKDSTLKSSLQGTRETVYYAANTIMAYRDGTWMKITVMPSKITAYSGVRAVQYVNGTVYVGTTDGLWEYSDGKWSSMGLPSPYTVLSLLYTNGALYAGTYGHGIWSFRNGQWTQLTKLPSDDVVTSLQYANHTLYAGTDSQGVWEYPVN